MATSFGVWASSQLDLLFGKTTTNISLNSKQGGAVPLQDVSLNCKLLDQCLDLELQHKYQNGSSSPIECIYKFPVIPGIVICGLEILLPDGKRIVCKPKEKSEAAAEYDDAIASGHGGYLLEKVDNSTYQMLIGNLPPNRGVTVTVRCLQVVVPLSDGNLRVLIPPALLPNTFSSNCTFSLDVSQSLGVKRIMSPTHKVSVKGSDRDTWNVAFKASSPSALKSSGGLVVDIELKTPGQPTVVVELDEATGDQVAMLSFHPKWDVNLDTQTFASEIIFLVDRSGSMSGASISYAKQTLLLFLRSLPEGVKFNIIGFGTRFESLFTQSVEYNEENLETACAVVEGMNADLGGTNLLQPLQNIFSLEYDDNYPRQVFILTDGEVANRDAVIALTENETSSTRVFTVGIGSSVDHALVTGLARAGKGRAEFVRDNADMKLKVVSQLQCALEPMLRAVKIRWRSEQGRNWKPTPYRTRPLFNGERMVAFAMLEGQSSEPDLSSVTIEGLGPDGKLLRKVLAVDRANVITGSTTIAKLAAATRIRELESGRSEHRVSGGEDRKLVKAEISALSLKYGLVCSETSFAGSEAREEATEGTMVSVDIRNQEVEHIQNVVLNEMMRNISLVSERADRIDCLVDRSEDLCYHSNMFVKRAERLSGGGVLGSVSNLGSSVGSWFASLFTPLGLSASSSSGSQSTSNGSDSDDLSSSSSGSSSSFVSTSSTTSCVDSDDRTRSRGSASSSHSGGVSDALVSQQKASGAWSLSDVAAFLGKDKQQLIDSFVKACQLFKPGDIASDAEVDLILGTALAIAVLHARFGSQRDEWSLVERKARAWIGRAIAGRGMAASAADALLAAAQKCVA